MRGPLQAALAVGLAALLSLMLSRVGAVGLLLALPIMLAAQASALLSAAGVALVTLRKGARDGALVAVLAGLGCALLGMPLLGSPWPAAVVALILWLPVWVLAAVLRFSGSLAFTAQLAGLGGVLAIGLVYWLAPDLSDYWVKAMEPVRQALVDNGGMDAQSARSAIAELARWITGAFAAGVLFQVLSGLFIGRWWQALLYNPGGFGADFRTFRLHPVFGVAGVVLLTLVAFDKAPGLVPNLVIVLVPLWMLQGLAVIHQLHADYRLSAGWLVALYLSMVFLMPHAELLVACMGLVDIWTDIRARLGRRPLGGG